MEVGKGRARGPVILFLGFRGEIMVAEMAGLKRHLGHKIISLWRCIRCGKQR